MAFFRGSETGFMQTEVLIKAVSEDSVFSSIILEEQQIPATVSSDFVAGVSIGVDVAYLHLK